MNIAIERAALGAGTVINGYVVREVLGGGNFGIVYRARHCLLGGVVALKEYLPVGLAVREHGAVRPRHPCEVAFKDGLRQFTAEARMLVKFRDDPAIVTCWDLFEAHGTAYLVMDYEDGPSLAALLHARESRGRPFDERELLELVVPLAEGLKRVHSAGVLHRGIRPSSILVRREDSRPLLIGFGTAKQFVAEQTKLLMPIMPGYAAWEQLADGDLGPWTDIYGLGAVMWRVVAGGDPKSPSRSPVSTGKRADALLRDKEDPLVPAQELGDSRFSNLLLGTIKGCLELFHEDRIRSFEELLGLLQAARTQSVGKSALLEAAQHNHTAAINVLLGAGANIEAKNERKQTPGRIREDTAA